MAIDPRERYSDPEEAMRAAMDGSRATMWTALPGIVVSFDPVAVTASIQPAIKGVVQGQDGKFSGVNLPVLPDVPVVFPHGGGCTLTFPIKPGDEVLVVFSARCIDAWWQSGGIQYPMEPRMHDLSDGFAIPGPMSQAKKIGGISTTAVQLRSDDGAAYVSINPATHQILTVTSGHADIVAASASISAPNIVLDGDVTVVGSLSIGGALTNAGKNVGASHTHGGVSTGVGHTAVPD